MSVNKKFSILKNLIIFFTLLQLILLYVYLEYWNGLPKKIVLDSSSSHDRVEYSSATAIVDDGLFPDSVQNKLYAEYVNTSERSNRPDSSKKDAYIIVEYTSVYRRSKYCHLKKSSDMLDKITDGFVRNQLDGENERLAQGEYKILDNCKYKNCLFTCDRQLSTEADVVMFHQMDLESEIKKLNTSGGDKIQQLMVDFKRDEDQIWLLWNDEAHPVNRIIDGFKFNWTISYKAQAQVSYCAYGCLAKSLDKKLRTHVTFKDYVRNQYKRRAGRSFWFVSNCRPKLRMNYAVKLGNFYPTVIYGTCNDKIRKNYPTREYKYLSLNETVCHRSSRCEMEIFRNNKFYLSLENQNCSDYITEKFWKSLTNDLIPIVLQPNREYYEKIAPKNSYIHMADFDYDLAKLGSYLNQVSTNFTLYSTYFEWKKEYRAIYQTVIAERLRMCELCFKLNNRHLVPKSHYSSVSSFFNSGCTRKNLIDVLN